MTFSLAKDGTPRKSLSRSLGSCIANVAGMKDEADSLAKAHRARRVNPILLNAAFNHLIDVMEETRTDPADIPAFERLRAKTFGEF